VRSLPTHFVQQHPRHLRIVIRRRHIRRRQTQLLRIALFIENLDGFCQRVGDELLDLPR